MSALSVECFVDQVRELARKNSLRLLQSGPGIHAYTLHKAQQLEAADKSIHHGLTDLVRTTLGPAATRRAERDIVALLGPAKNKEPTQ